MIGLFRHIFSIISRRSFSKRQPVSFILVCRYLNDGITGENHSLSFEFSSRTLAFYTSSNRISNNVKNNNYEQLAIFEGPDVLFASIQQNCCDYCSLKIDWSILVLDLLETMFSTVLTILFYVFNLLPLRQKADLNIFLSII